jgi:eukaryotic-like serine/threonine-protein kinase
MPENRLCNRCGEPLPPNMLESTCPACMRSVLEADSVPETTGISARDNVTFSFEPVQPGHVLEMLTQSIGSIPRVLLPETAPDEIGAAATMPSSDEIPTPAERGDRYQLFGEIARGGMGAVLKGRDPDLGRDLAVKVLLESHEHKPELIRRFVEEAQIGGQLQHPGIVPVYELGAFPDRRPYFTMKLVKGSTLSSLLHDRSIAVQSTVGAGSVRRSDQDTEQADLATGESGRRTAPPTGRAEPQRELPIRGG